MDQSTHSFVARGEAYRHQVSVPVTITGSYSDLEADPVQCKVVPDTDKSTGASSDLFDKLGTLQLRGKTEHGQSVYIPQFQVSRTTHSGDQMFWEGIAEFFVEGDLDEFDASGGTIVCTAFIPPTPLASPKGVYITNLDGTITFEGEDRKGIRWNTDLGEAELIEGYDYQHEKIGLNEARIQIKQCQVTIKSESPGTVSLEAMSNDLQDALDEPLWLLSFLSRKRVGWYEAQLLFLPPEDTPHKRFRRAIVRRRQWLGYKTGREKDISWIDLLAQRQALVDGVFQQVYDSYNASPQKETIRRLIPYLLGAHEVGYIETRLGILYSALDGLVNSLDKGYLLGSGCFKRLSKKLRNVIREEIERHDVAEEVIKKLPELRRRSYVDRLLMLFDKYDLEVTRLWPSGVNIPSEIQALVKRRDVFIHQGVIDDYDPYILDLYRILNLVELWILRLLGYPSNAINDLSASSQYPINRP